MTVSVYRNLLIAASLLALLLAAGCEGGGGDDLPDSSDSYLPLAVGNSWNYLMTLAPDVEPFVPEQAGENQLFDYHETVEPPVTIEGVEYFLIRTLREATDEWDAYPQEQLRRITRDAVYSRLLFLDEDENLQYEDVIQLRLPPRVGDTWHDEWLGATFTTVAIDEQVTVPAGTFNCVRVEMSMLVPEHADGEYEGTNVVAQSEEDQGGSGENGDGVLLVVKTWYARGVGIVRDQTWEDDAKMAMIELTEYTVQ